MRARAFRAGNEISLRRWLTVLIVAGVMTVAGAIVLASNGVADVEGREVPSEQATGGEVPGGVYGAQSTGDMWRDIRRGIEGQVAQPDARLGILIQSQGENWRAIRNGPVSVYGSWALLGMLALLAIFFALRGRIKIEAGHSGRTIERFDIVDRFAHWLTAVSFVILAITGLNLLYGRHVLLPVIGPTAFAWFTEAGKYLHNFLAFPFMLGVALMFVLWVRHNLPGKHDVQWLIRGGGIFGGGHPPARKFNAGQKVVFWAVILGGLSISLSGIALLFPFSFSFFAGTFEIINWFGFNLPTDFGPVQEQQLNQVWHAIVGIILIAIILAHIYIGTIGMEGAFDAMGTGQVDESWAREHHSLWYTEVTGRETDEGRGAPEKAPTGGHGQPAE